MHISCFCTYILAEPVVRVFSAITQVMLELEVDRLTAGISILTTCYNERENIQKLIPAIRSALTAVPHEIIVVDDSSPDRTIEVARQLADVAVSKEREGQISVRAEQAIDEAGAPPLRNARASWDLLCCMTRHVCL